MSTIQAKFNITSKTLSVYSKIAMNQLVSLLRKRQILICCRENTWKEDMTEDGKSKELGHFQDLLLPSLVSYLTLGRILDIFALILKCE